MRRIGRLFHFFYSNKPFMPFVHLCFFLFVINQINTLNCPANTWACNNGIQCINSTFKCNSVIDCSDGSDEGAICSLFFTNSYRFEFNL